MALVASSRGSMSPKIVSSGAAVEDAKNLTAELLANGHHNHHNELFLGDRKTSIVQQRHTRKQPF